MLEKLINNFLSYLIDNNPDIFLVTDDSMEKGLELITNPLVCNVKGIDCRPLSISSGDFDLSKACAKISLNDASNSDNSSEPSDPNNICDISKKRILTPYSDKMSKTETRHDLKINSEELSASGPAESSDHFVDLGNVIQTCETKWHSFFKEVETVKESSLENCTFNQDNRTLSNSIETTGMKRQEKPEYQEIQCNDSYSKVIEACKRQWPSFLKDKTVRVPSLKEITFSQAKDKMLNSVQTTGIKLKEKIRNKKNHEDETYPSMESEQREVRTTSAHKNLSISQNCSSSKKFHMSHSCTINNVELSSYYSSHSATINCEQRIIPENSTDEGKSKIAELPESSSISTVEVRLLNSSHFPLSNTNNQTEIPELILEHSVNLYGGKLLDPRLNPNRKRKRINDRKEIVLKRVKWACDPAVLRNLKSSNKILPHPKICVVHPEGSAMSSKISDPRLKHSKIFSKHSVPTFHKAKVSSSEDSVSNSPTLSPPRIHNHQHISSVGASNKNILSQSLPNSPSCTKPLKKRKYISSLTSPLERRTISSSLLEKPDISSSTSPSERRDISSSTSSEKLKTKFSSNSMDDRSLTLPIKKRKLLKDVESSMECGKNSSSNNISISEHYNNCESINKSRDEGISTLGVGNGVDTTTKSLDEISTFISSIRNQTNKEKSISSFEISGAVRRNQSTESNSRQDRTSDSVTIDTSKKGLDSPRVCMMSPTENSLLCRRLISNVEEESSMSNDVIFRNEYSHTLKSVNVGICSRHSSINVNSKGNCFPSEISSVSQKKSKGINKTSYNLKKYEEMPCSQWEIWREKYLKSKAKKQANKLVVRNESFCNKTHSRTKQSDPISQDSTDISNVKSSESQTMNSRAPLSNYFDNEGILKIVHICSQVEIGEAVIFSVKLPLKLVSRLCWKYYLDFLLMRLNKIISKEKLTSNRSFINIFKLSLKYPLAKHLIRHSNNGLKGDLKYLLLQFFKKHYLLSFAIAHEDSGITAELNDKTLNVNSNDEKSSIKPMNLVADCNVLQNISSESNSTQHVCLNSHILAEAFSSDDTIVYYDEMFNETNSINKQIQQDYEAVSEKINDLNFNTVLLNSVADCSAFQNLPSESNDSVHVCRNSRSSLRETFYSDVPTLYYKSDMLDETEETKRNKVHVEGIKIPTLQNNKIESETIHKVKPYIPPMNSVADFNVPSELKNTNNIHSNSHTDLTEVISSDRSNLFDDCDMLDEAERNDMHAEDIEIPIEQNIWLESETTSDVKSYITPTFSVAGFNVLQNISSESQNTDNVRLNPRTILTEVFFSDVSTLCYDKDMLDETEEIKRTNAYAEDIKIPTVQNNFGSGVCLNSHTILAEVISSDDSNLCFDSEMLDETEEIESNKISSQVSLDSRSVFSETLSVNSNSCFDSEMINETEEIERNKDTMYHEDIQIPTQRNDEITGNENTTAVISHGVHIKSEELEHNVYRNSDSVLPEISSADDSRLCGNSEELDETEEGVENNNISSNFWLTLNSMWEDFFQFTELGFYFGSKSDKFTLKLLRKKGISFPTIEYLLFLNNENKFISENHRNPPLNYGKTFTSRNITKRMVSCFLHRSCERFKTEFLCEKYFSNKIPEVLFSMKIKIKDREFFQFFKTFEKNFESLTPPHLSCFKRIKKLIPIKVDPEHNKKRMPCNVVSEQNKPIYSTIYRKPVRYKVDSERQPISHTIYSEQNQKPMHRKVHTKKIELYLQQNKIQSHHEVHPVSSNEIDEVCNMIKVMRITVSSDTSSDDRIENNSGILDPSSTDVMYHMNTDKVPLCPKSLAPTSSSELEILCTKQRRDTRVGETSPRIFNSNCQFKNEKICFSTGIDELFEGFDLFKEDGVLYQYYKHLKECGDHTVNLKIIEMNEKKLQGKMLKMYRILKEELDHRRYILRGLVDLASSSETTDMRIIEEIVVLSDNIKAYEIACKGCFANVC
ncbi:unnamed protein product [Larinioides sclopetarius]|uniref:Uncharacterized protein n=1 Tax=Larinioides sclopetarius TaxID=280406 RepID=A0AAV2AH78_9ARAC